MPFPDHPRLFSSRRTPPPGCVVARIDGGARGNPGPAAYGVVVEDAEGRRLAELSHYLGPRTNNYAEYAGLLAAVQYALDHGLRSLRVLSDSELLVRQMTGRYKVRSPELRPLFERAQSLLHGLEWFAIEHVRREHNRAADRLVNEALDHHQGGG